jgi:hypothetical protein
MMLAGQPLALSQPIENCVVPTTGLPDGPVFVYITNDEQPLSSNLAVQNAAQIAAGPAIAFIDQQTDMLGALVRTTGNGKQQDALGSNGDLSVLGITMQ